MDTFGNPYSYRDNLLIGELLRLVIALVNNGNSAI